MGAVAAAAAGDTSHLSLSGVLAAADLVVLEKGHGILDDAPSPK